MDNGTLRALPSQPPRCSSGTTSRAPPTWRTRSSGLSTTSRRSPRNGTSTTFPPPRLNPSENRHRTDTLVLLVDSGVSASGWNYWWTARGSNPRPPRCERDLGDRRKLLRTTLLPRFLFYRRYLFRFTAFAAVNLNPVSSGSLWTPPWTPRRDLGLCTLELDREHTPMVPRLIGRTVWKHLRSFSSRRHSLHQFCEMDRHLFTVALEIGWASTSA